MTEVLFKSSMQCFSFVDAKFASSESNLVLFFLRSNGLKFSAAVGVRRGAAAPLFLPQLAGRVTAVHGPRVPDPGGLLGPRRRQRVLGRPSGHAGRAARSAPDQRRWHDAHVPVVPAHRLQGARTRCLVPLRPQQRRGQDGQSRRQGASR